MKSGQNFLKFTDTAQCLGLAIDRQLSWNDHVQIVCKSFNKKLGVLKRIKFLPKSTLETIYFKTIIPSVLYGVAVWGSCSSALLEKLERIHARAARLIYNLPRETTINDLRNLKGWSPLSHFYTKRILSITYKSFHGLNNDLLNKLVTKSAQVYGLRKSLNINVTRPKTETGRLTFKHRAAIAWNTLPDSIKEASSLEAFKEKLKKNKPILSSISYSKESSSITNKDDIYTYF